MAEEQRSEANVAKAIAADTERTITRTVGTCVVIIALAVLGFLHSCSQPTNDPAAIAKIQTDNQARIACIQRGGNWMPIVTRRFDTGGVADSEMGCIRPEAVAEVNKVNSPPPK